MKWPAQNLDLNPIENLWHIITELIRKRNPKNLDDLWRKNSRGMEKVTPELCNKLSRSCGRSFLEVIQNKGFHTLY